MDLKLLAFTACLLIGSACAQDDQDYDGLYANLTILQSAAARTLVQAWAVQILAPVRN